MADYLILKQESGAAPGPGGWQVVNLAKNKTADVAGATAALTESYNGPGRYGVVRADNARTVTLSQAAPAITDDPSPAW